MCNLDELIKDIDIYISQHSIYVNRLEKSIEEGKDFEIINCHECDFGKDFDLKLKPEIDECDEDVKTTLKEIEKIHCDFHEKIKEIYTSNASKEEKKARIKEIEKFSTELFRKLLYLKHFVLKGV
jgi:hypothetical protein